MNNRLPKVGAHVSAAVSLERSFDKALEIGADCTQFFISPPQQWAQTIHNTEEIERYKKRKDETQIGPNFIHGTYLINLGTQDAAHLQKSTDWLVYGLKIAELLDVRGVIFHTGSHKGVGFESVLDQVSSSLKNVLEKAPGQTFIILENSGGGGGSIGRNFKELGLILKAVDNPRVKVCMDIQHAYATGYDLKTPTGLNSALDEFEREIGMDNLAAMHANDSKTELNSSKDRHENIGEGFIGKEGFENIINHPLLKLVPFILEVPGILKKGPDKENVSLLKGLIKD